MPLKQSAIKAHRQSLTKRSRNKHFVALYKETLKKFEKAIATGSADAGQILSHLQSDIDTLVKKNILHKNTAARKKSAHAKALAKAGSALAPVAMPKSARATPAKKATAPKKSTTTEKAPTKAKAPSAAKKALAKKTK
jgi:small subunit ribosomal protein S20